MGHYDNCRPENCSVCGQALGSCEHTREKVEQKESWRLPITSTNVKAKPNCTYINSKEWKNPPSEELITLTGRPKNSDPPFQMIRNPIASYTSASAPKFDFKAIEEIIASLPTYKLVVYMNRKTTVSMSVIRQIKSRGIDIEYNEAVPIGQGMLVKLPTLETPIEEQMMNLSDELCQSIIDTPYEELRKEMIEDGEDPNEVVKTMKDILARAKKEVDERI